MIIMFMREMMVNILFLEIRNKEVRKMVKKPKKTNSRIPIWLIEALILLLGIIVGMCIMEVYELAVLPECQEQDCTTAIATAKLEAKVECLESKIQDSGNVNNNITVITEPAPANCRTRLTMKEKRPYADDIRKHTCYTEAVTNIPESTPEIRWSASKGININRVCGEDAYGEITVEVVKKTMEGTESEVLRTDVELVKGTVSCDEILVY